MTTYLDKIVDHKKKEIQKQKHAVPIEVIKDSETMEHPTRPFAKCLIDKMHKKENAVIAEVKKASPSKGLIREDFNPTEIAKSYEQGGATCVSVLTDQNFFQGHNDYIQEVKAACELPIIRKDFIIEPYQIYEARSIGADCILLIAAILDDAKLQIFMELASALEMDTLIEIHDQEELERVLPLKPELIGINNRNLKTFETNLYTSIELAKKIPEDIMIITESGIHTREDVELMNRHDIFGFLIGESLMRVEHPHKKLELLIGERT